MTTMNHDEAMKAELAQLKAENAMLKEKALGKAGKIKISEKKAVSIYGFGRFPVTLYKSQWRLLNKAMPEVMAFIAANEASLADKE